MAVNGKRLFVLALAGVGAYWLIASRTMQKGEAATENGFFVPDVFGFLKASLNDAGNYLQDAFDLANSDFRTSVTSGRGNQFVGVIEKIGEAKGLPPFLLSRIAYQESRFRPDATNPSGARGMFQINKITQLEMSRQMAKQFDPFNWQQAAEGAAVYLAYLYAKFGTWLLAVAAYNAGPGTLQKNMAANGGKWNPATMPQAEQRVYALQVMADIPADY
ncbi:transglycosylase SLT domain-containing protein [Chitinibacter bivalviorum]|uniref:Transglycosylase SLT domain-containing protein n=1 Tax=Chitinibacter bivalviorum TaxID=2739434 RepID=A0A7H9BGD0_9NEIS|nr:transglycosylase SLT domain-containing protein [Chitinibacter bivalviorum]QLG87599.1 transglycosylase SLT domain-containing protein [Chitinibacter bivalviorum]